MESHRSTASPGNTTSHVCWPHVSCAANGAMEKTRQSQSNVGIVYLCPSTGHVSSRDWQGERLIFCHCILHLLAWLHKHNTLLVRRCAPSHTYREPSSLLPTHAVPFSIAKATSFSEPATQDWQLQGPPTARANLAARVHNVCPDKSCHSSRRLEPVSTCKDCDTAVVFLALLSVSCLGTRFWIEASKASSAHLPSTSACRQHRRHCKR